MKTILFTAPLCVFILCQSISTRAQYLDSNAKISQPVYQNREGISFAHFLTNNTWVTSTKSVKGQRSQQYNLVTFDGTSMKPLKDITEEFYSKSDSCPDFTLQVVDGHDFVYARQLPYGLIKSINAKGEVANVHFIKDQKYKEGNIAPYFGIIEPGATTDQIYGLSAGFTAYTINNEENRNYKPLRGEAFPSGKLAWSRASQPENLYCNNQYFLYIMTHDPKLQKDYERKTNLVLAQRNTTLAYGSEYKRVMFVKEDYSKGKFRTYTYGKKEVNYLESDNMYFYRGPEEKATTFALNSKKTIAYVGYSDGVVDAYDLISSNNTEKILPRLKRLYSDPLNQIVKLTYCDKLNYLAVAEYRPSLRGQLIIKLWDLNKDKLIAFLSEKNDTCAFRQAKTAQLYNLAFSPDGTYVLAIGKDKDENALKVWHTGL